jgi:predicted glutamine amidotransferase
MACNKETNLLYSFGRLSEIAKQFSHKDGWGITWLNQDNRFELHKGPKPIWESRSAQNHVQNARSKLIVVHARKSLKDDASKKRAHPFRQVFLDKEWIFAHNGGIESPAPKKCKPRSDVDSERFFCYLIDTMEEVNRNMVYDEKRLVIEALRHALKKAKIVTALNFIMANPRNLFVFRYHVKNPDYYNVLYLTRSWQSTKGAELGKEKGEIATIFSSQRLSTNEIWHPLKNAHLAIVPIGEPEKLEIVSI